MRAQNFSPKVLVYMGDTFLNGKLCITSLKIIDLVVAQPSVLKRPSKRIWMRKATIQ